MNHDQIKLVMIEKITTAAMNPMPNRNPSAIDNLGVAAVGMSANLGASTADFVRNE